jgi:hypothetical protein
MKYKNLFEVSRKQVRLNSGTEFFLRWGECDIPPFFFLNIYINLGFKFIGVYL